MIPIFWHLPLGDACELQSLCDAIANAARSGDVERVRYLREARCRLLRGIAVGARGRMAS